MNLFDLILYSTFSRVLFDETISESVKQIRYEALQQLSHILTFYKKKGYDDRLLMPIAEKKCEMILKCNSKTEMDKIIKPKCPHYNGNKFVPGEYNVLEEELIGWSQASLTAPLNDAGFKRFMEVFMLVFPDDYKRILGAQVGGLKDDGSH